MLSHGHLVSCALVLCVLALSLGREKAPFADLTVWLFAFFLAVTLSGICFQNARLASMMASLLRCAFFIPFLLPEKEEKIIRLFAAVGGLLGVLCLIQALLGKGATGYADQRVFANLSRATATFQNPNLLAVFLLPCTLFSLHIALSERKRRLFFSLCALLGTVGILLTYSRGAILGLSLSAFYLFSRRFGLKSTLLTLLAFLPLLSLLLPQDLLSRMGSLLSPDSSMTYRFSLWRSFSRLPLPPLLFGVGEGKEAFLAFVRPSLAAGLIQIEHTHSLFLQILLADGIVGLLLFLTLCLFAFFRCREDGRKAAFLALLFFGVFDNPLYAGQTEVIFWLTLGLLAKAKKQSFASSCFF